jgi:hypothetical protein
MKHGRRTLVVTMLAALSACGGDDAGPLDSGVPPVPSPDAGAADAGSTKCGTGASGAPSATIPATFETVKLVLGGGGGIMPCAAAPCHGVNGMAPPDHPLELPPTDDQKLYTNLMSYVSKACGNAKLVEPCNPSKSALVAILNGPCGMTPRMPYGCSPTAGDCIPEEYVAAVSQWIANGAPR